MMQMNEGSLPYGYGVPPPPQGMMQGGMMPMDNGFGCGFQPFGPPAPNLMPPGASSYPELAIQAPPGMGMPMGPMMMQSGMPMQHGMPMQPGMQMQPGMPMQQQQQQPQISREQWDDFHKRRNASVKKQGFTTKDSGKIQFDQQQQGPGAIPQNAADAYLQSIGAQPAPAQPAQAPPMQQYPSGPAQPMQQPYPAAPPPGMPQPGMPQPQPGMAPRTDPYGMATHYPQNVQPLPAQQYPQGAQFPPGMQEYPGGMQHMQGGMPWPGDPYSQGGYYPIPPLAPEHMAQPTQPMAYQMPPQYPPAPPSPVAYSY